MCLHSIGLSYLVSRVPSETVGGQVSPTSGHTSQMLREFDAFVHSEAVL